MVQKGGGGGIPHKCARLCENLTKSSMNRPEAYTNVAA